MASVDDVLGPEPPWHPDTIAKYAGPGRITSSLRSPGRNAAVGGAPTSSHMSGQAFDWAPADGDTARAARALAASGVPYDQIIDEGTHVHIGYGPKMRNQVLGLNGRPAPKPSVDDFLGAPPKPSVDDLLGPATPAAAAAPVKQKPVSSTRPALPVKKPGFLDQVGELGQEFQQDYGERLNRAGEAIKQGLNAGRDENGTVTDPLAYLGGMAQAAAGGFSALVSPVAAPVTTAVGRPAERLSGGRYPAQNAGDIAEGLMGFVGAPEAAGAARAGRGARVAAEAAPAIEGEFKVKPSGPLPHVDEVLGAPTEHGNPLPPVDDVLGDMPPVATKPKTLSAEREDPFDEVLIAPNTRTYKTYDPTAAPTPPTPVDQVKDALGAVQKIFAPATVGLGREAAGVIRGAAASGDLEAARATEKLAEHARLVDNLPVPEQRALVGYIENRSSGAKLDNPELQKTADDIRAVNEAYRGRIEQTLGVDEGPSFIRDYYSHMWKESPQYVENALIQSRQGSGRNLKARVIPTIQEGLDAGLTPVTENPIENTLNYANNMSRYLATIDTQKQLAESGMTKWAAPGQVPDGWVPLDGIRTEKPGRVIIQDGETVAAPASQKLYAPADVARVYNNWISKGLEQGDLGPLFTGARQVSNGMTQLKLGLSAFHAVTMVNEAMVSEMARGIQAASRGDLATAGKAIGSAPGAFVTRYLRGARMRDELLGSKEALDSTSQAINDAYIRAGGRVRMDRLYRARGSGSFYNAIADGTWKRELKATYDRIAGSEGGLRPADRAAGVVDLGANLIQSFAAPLFEHYIPRLKQGAFASTMEDFMKANPGATQAELDKAAFEINRSIDNRFGEMAWDNLFWRRELKQVSQLMLLSPSWNIGTINEIGGGLVDMLGPSAKGLAAGKGVTTRTAYVAALAAQVALVNGILTYLKTGKPPQDAKDFMAYRTGGTDASSGQPERAMIPGYQKDVYAFGYDFPNHVGQEIENKLNPALKTALELNANKDFRGLPIRNTNAPLAEQAGQVGDYALDQLMPISIGQLSKREKRGSNLSTGEKALAIRPAPSYVTAPERQEKFKEQRMAKEWKRKERADRRDANLRGQ